MPRKKKYSNSFERDYNWYLTYRGVFTFDGGGDFSRRIVVSPDGKDAKRCFHEFDSRGQIVPTKEPELLSEIYLCKGAINFNIKQWAEDRANGLLPRVEFDQLVKEYELLDWMVEAVERQRWKFPTKPTTW